VCGLTVFTSLYDPALYAAFSLYTHTAFSHNMHALVALQSSCKIHD